MQPLPGEMPIDEWRAMMDAKSEDSRLKKKAQDNGRRLARLIVQEKSAELDAREARLQRGKFDSPEARRAWVHQATVEREAKRLAAQHRETDRLHAELREQIRRLSEEQVRLSAPRRKRAWAMHALVLAVLIEFAILAVMVGTYNPL